MSNLVKISLLFLNGSCLFMALSYSVGYTLFGLALNTGSTPTWSSAWKHINHTAARFQRILMQVFLPPAKEVWGKVTFYTCLSRGAILSRGFHEREGAMKGFCEQWFCEKGGHERGYCEDGKCPCKVRRGQWLNGAWRTPQIGQQEGSAHLGMHSCMS